MDVDLNADLGEGAGSDADLIPLVTSANVACGFHAGDPVTALRTLRLTAGHAVRVGAHPGHPDREHFGRRELDRTPEQVFADCIYQIGALIGLAQVAGCRVSYVKPHGGLYHQSSRDDGYAEPVVAATERFGLALIGLPGSRLAERSAGRCPFFAEGFADRRYRSDGTLVPRDQPGAMVDDPAEALRQVEWLLAERGVRTICVHGDNPQALRFVQELRRALLQRGFRLKAFT
jgi:5-oxoprolinase (ATP-hydrolysing) subunit A